MDTKTSFSESKKYFPTPIQEFQFLDKYSRFNYDKGRREAWVETVDRAVNYLRELSKEQLSEDEYTRLRQFILEMKASPSMRLIAMAGEAARRQNISIYNCSYLPIDSIDSFVEELTIAMAGCGVGFSVEKQYVDKLPVVMPYTGNKNGKFIIEDSTEGWAVALRKGLETWFAGEEIWFDYSQIRPAGTPLKIKGGRASGPEPFESLMEFTREIIMSRGGKTLRPIDAHRIACKIGEAIVSGGVRRTALISLFDMSDEEMRNCKNQAEFSPELWMANNSAVWDKNITNKQITNQMLEMRDGQRGEPGIFSRYNANRLAPERRKQFGEKEYGTNPCGEINLRPYEFCNLSIAIAREGDTEETLKEKIEVATIIGTIQSMGTYFPGLRDIWKKNCEEERLLGVDINGWRDTKILDANNPDLPNILQRLKDHAVETNKKYAALLGINQSVSVTCVKPSGNSGVLFNCSSGLHARWSPYYIRRVRITAKSPIAKIMREQGVSLVPELGQTMENATTVVASFPMKSPEGSITKDDLTAIEQCEYWLVAKQNWTEHNPSVTITYKLEEFADLLAWVIDHKDLIGGMSFFPNSDAKYDLPPNEEITKEKYEELLSEFPILDFSLLPDYEKEDYTTSSMELACVSGVCDIADHQASTQQAPIIQMS